MKTDKTCSCYIGGKIKSNIPVIRDNDKTVIVLFKGKEIKRHKEKHDVKIK